jgi:signal transduction histidine kinase
VQLGFGWISTKIGVMMHISGRVKFASLLMKILRLGTFVLVIFVGACLILGCTHPFVSPAYGASGDSQINSLAENEDGINQTVFWESWWFIGLVGLILGASVVIGYRWRFQFIEQHRQRLAVEVFERTEEIERRRQMASGLSDIVRLLNSNQPLEMSLDFIVQQAVGLTEASKAAIFDRQGDLVVVRACYPPGETYLIDLKNPDSISGRCLLESTFLNKPLILSRIDPETMKSDTRWELVSGDYRTALCTPLVVEEAVYGGLVLYYGQERAFTPEEVRFAHTLADQASLAITNAQLKIKAQEAAVVAERSRLARELHDAVTQTLFSASLIADVLPKLWDKDPQQAHERVEELQHLTHGALGEMRTLLMELRPSALNEADPGELLKHLADAFTGRTGVPVHFDLQVPSPCEIPSDVKLVFYRVAQEGLSNILKHAQATRVWMQFRCDLEMIDFMLRDDGLGFNPDHLPPGHLGLGIMEERAISVGAALTFSSQPGEGTVLRLVWNFKENTLE